MLLAIQVVAVFLVSVAMALAWAHALELPGKMRLNKEQYLATQAIHYPGFTIGGGAEPLAMLATLWLLLLTPANSPAFWWTLTSLLGIAAMHAVFWTVTQPVNKFWVSGLKPKGASAAFLGPVEPKATIGEGYEVQWQASRNQWEYSHLGRAILSAISLISLAISPSPFKTRGRSLVLSTLTSAAVGDDTVS